MILGRKKKEKIALGKKVKILRKLENGNYTFSIMFLVPIFLAPTWVNTIPNNENKEISLGI